METIKVTIIYLEKEMLISKKQYSSWRDIQDEYETFKTSLGPWSSEEVISYLNDEYWELSPPASDQVAALLAGKDAVSPLTFE